MAALCYAVKKMHPIDIATFPGLQEWKERHDYIDKHKEVSGYQYDKKQGRDVYAGPLYMEVFMKAFPKKI